MSVEQNDFKLLLFIVVAFGLSPLLVYGRFHISSNRPLLNIFNSHFSILVKPPLCS